MLWPLTSPTDKLSYNYGVKLDGRILFDFLLGTWMSTARAATPSIAGASEFQLWLGQFFECVSRPKFTPNKWSSRFLRISSRIFVWLSITTLCQLCPERIRTGLTLHKNSIWGIEQKITRCRHYPIWFTTSTVNALDTTNPYYSPCFPMFKGTGTLAAPTGAIEFSLRFILIRETTRTLFVCITVEPHMNWIIFVVVVNFSVMTKLHMSHDTVYKYRKGIF